MIRKIGKEYHVLAKTGRCMGHYSSKTAAEKRLKQIELFKHMRMKK